MREQQTKGMRSNFYPITVDTKRATAPKLGNKPGNTHTKRRKNRNGALTSQSCISLLFLVIVTCLDLCTPVECDRAWLRMLSLLFPFSLFGRVSKVQLSLISLSQGGWAWLAKFCKWLRTLKLTIWQLFTLIRPEEFDWFPRHGTSVSVGAWKSWVLSLTAIHLEDGNWITPIVHTDLICWP